MLKNLREFFENQLAPARQGDEVSLHTIEFAAAVLMYEISRADSSIGDDERQVIDQALTRHFNLSQQEADELQALAEKEVDHSVSLYDFTRTINNTLTPTDKVKIVEILWHVAFADAVLDKYEEYFIRKIADLLYVSHKDYMQAKHRAGSGESPG